MPEGPRGEEGPRLPLPLPFQKSVVSRPKGDIDGF